MDIVGLVESGKYTTEGFDSLQMEFIDGLDVAINSVDDCIANRFETFDDSTMLEKMVAEIQTDAAKQVKDWLYGVKCEAIVSFGDDNACGEESN